MSIQTIFRANFKYYLIKPIALNLLTNGLIYSQILIISSFDYITYKYQIKQFYCFTICTHSSFLSYWTVFNLDLLENFVLFVYYYPK